MKNPISELQEMTHREIELVALEIDVCHAYDKAQAMHIESIGTPPSNASCFHWPNVANDTAKALGGAFPIEKLKKQAFYEALDLSIATHTTNWANTLELRN